MGKFSQAPEGGEERGEQGRARSWHELAGGQEGSLQAMRALDQEQGQEVDEKHIRVQAVLEALATAEEETRVEGNVESPPGGKSWGEVAREGREQAELGQRLDQLGGSVEGGQEEEGDSLQPERTMAALGEGESEETDSLQVLYCTLQVLYCTLQVLCCALQVQYCNLQVLYCTLRVLYFTLEVLCFTLRVLYCTLQVLYCTLEVMCCTLKLLYCSLP